MRCLLSVDLKRLCVLSVNLGEQSHTKARPGANCRGLHLGAANVQCGFALEAGGKGGVNKRGYCAVRFQNPHVDT